MTDRKYPPDGSKPTPGGASTFELPLTCTGKENAENMVRYMASAGQTVERICDTLDITIGHFEDTYRKIYNENLHKMSVKSMAIIDKALNDGNIKVAMWHAKEQKLFQPSPPTSTDKTLLSADVVIDADSLPFQIPGNKKQ